MDIDLMIFLVDEHSCLQSLTAVVRTPHEHLRGDEGIHFHPTSHLTPVPHFKLLGLQRITAHCMQLSTAFPWPRFRMQQR